MRTLTTLILFIVSMFIVSCNTMEGMGRDIKVGGKKLEKSAQENK
jgi:predicted small secreted protein